MALEDTVSNKIQPSRFQSLKKSVIGAIAGLALAVSSYARCGDHDGNGQVNILDALGQAQVAVGLIQQDPRQVLENDVDRNGVTNVLDSLRTAQYSVGLPIIFLCPETATPVYDPTPVGDNHPELLDVGFTATITSASNNRAVLDGDTLSATMGNSAYTSVLNLGPFDIIKDVNSTGDDLTSYAKINPLDRKYEHTTTFSDGLFAMQGTGDLTDIIGTEFMLLGSAVRISQANYDNITGNILFELEEVGGTFRLRIGGSMGQACQVYLNDVLQPNMQANLGFDMTGQNPQLAPIELESITIQEFNNASEIRIEGDGAEREVFSTFTGTARMTYSGLAPIDPNATIETTDMRVTPSQDTVIIDYTSSKGDSIRTEFYKAYVVGDARESRVIHQEGRGAPDYNVTQSTGKSVLVNATAGGESYSRQFTVDSVGGGVMSITDLASGTEQIPYNPATGTGVMNYNSPTGPLTTNFKVEITSGNVTFDHDGNGIIQEGDGHEAAYKLLGGVEIKMDPAPNSDGTGIVPGTGLLGNYVVPASEIEGNPISPPTQDITHRIGVGGSYQSAIVANLFPDIDFPIHGYRSSLNNHGDLLRDNYNNYLTITVPSSQSFATFTLKD